MSISSIEFRDALSRAVTPVTVVTTSGVGGLAGVTCSAVSSVCDTPPTVLVCVNRRSFVNAVIKANDVLCVNWLSEAQAHVSQMFAGVGEVPMTERFTQGRWGTLATGAPYSKDAVVSLDCRVSATHEVGSHTVFLAEVLANAHADTGSPLVYQSRCYGSTRPT